MYERRTCARFRVLKSAKLVLSGSVRDCIVRNLSGRGARIEIPNTVELPELLQITFDRGRSTRQCRSVWRTFCGMGVEFL
jgi:hypothetical protein